MFFSIRLRPLLAAILLLPLMAACSTVDVASTQKMKSVGSEFQQSLHFQYAELAFAEDKRGDNDATEYYNNKAMAAARGEAVLPTAMAERKLPAANVKELTAARDRLANALGSGGPRHDPKNMARAQAMFDCWMEEQEENFQPDDIKACRSGFENAIDFVDKAIMAAKPKPAAMAMPMAEMPKPLVVYFGFDSFDIDDATMAVIGKTTKAALAAKATKVVVTGHTDLAGSNKYNEGLARARATAVGNALMVAGMPRAGVDKMASGETKPDVKTKDGKKEPLNRRVVVIFQK